MYNRLKRLYDESKITINELQNAIERGWITEEEFNEITAQK